MLKGLLIQTKKIISRPLLFRSHYKFYGFNNEVPKYDPTKDYYRILDVNKNSSDTQIKKAYYSLAKQYHPDSNPGFQGKFKQINEAYTVLSDKKVKKQYDSARTMKGFSRKMGSKAEEGHYDFREYRS